MSELEENYDWYILNKVVSGFYTIIDSNLTKHQLKNLQKIIQFRCSKLKNIGDKGKQDKFLKTIINEEVRNHINEIAFKIKTDEKTIKYLSNYIFDMIKKNMS